MTLIELVISIFIASLIFVIIFIFLSGGTTAISQTEEKTSTYQTVFDFKVAVGKMIEKGYNTPYILQWSADAYSSLLLLDKDKKNGVLIWVVDKETRKLKKKKVYGKNFLALYELSKHQINTNSLSTITTETISLSVVPGVYNLQFFSDKIFSLSVVRDFDVELYSGDMLSEKVIEIWFSLLHLADEDLIGTSYEDITIDISDLETFKLIY